LDNPYKARLALVLLAALLSALTALLTTLTRLLVLLARILLAWLLFTALLLTTLLAALIRIFVTHGELLLYCGTTPQSNNSRNNILVPKMHSGTIDGNTTI